MEVVKGNFYYLECIKTFKACDEISPTFEGEVFRVNGEDWDILVGVEYKSLNPGMEICLSTTELLNFKIHRFN